MPPRVPKTIPKWVPLLFDHLSRHSQDAGAQHLYDALAQQAEAQWDSFHAAHQPAVPPPKKTQDPTKALERTLKRCNDAFEAAPRRARRQLVADFSEQMQSLNPVLRDALAVAQVGGDNENRGERTAAAETTGNDQVVFADHNSDVQEDDGEMSLQRRLMHSSVEAQGSSHRTPQRLRVKRQRRAPLVQRSEELYEAFRAEAQGAGIDDSHPLVASVEQLYGMARELIDSATDVE